MGLKINHHNVLRLEMKELRDYSQLVKLVFNQKSGLFALGKEEFRRHHRCFLVFGMHSKFYLGDSRQGSFSLKTQKIICALRF